MLSVPNILRIFNLYGVELVSKSCCLFMQLKEGIFLGQYVIYSEEMTMILNQAKNIYEGGMRYKFNIK